MATISFEEDLIVDNHKKIEEIMAALQQPRDGSVTPICPPELPKNAGAIWFRRFEK
ncbi:MAG: hypothetical protein IJW92_03720 [Clostridia bacterium]|nr:hypothetical protein [Clostridia bacterium]